jgi:hypothetical protein
MPPAAPGQDLAGDRVRGGEEGRRAMPAGVGGATKNLPRAHQQEQLRPVGGLVRTHLIHEHHQGPVRETRIESRDVADLTDEVGAGGEPGRLRALRRLQRCEAWGSSSALRHRHDPGRRACARAVSRRFGRCSSVSRSSASMASGRRCRPGITAHLQVGAPGVYPRPSGVEGWVATAAGTKPRSGLCERSG